MKVAKLMHNPKAGDKEHSKEILVEEIEKRGYKCLYASVKEKGWKDIEPEVDFLVVAGGDGTVRKVATALLQRKVIERNYPIAVLPLGTANNIGRTLGLSSDIGVMDSWATASVEKFDVGQVNGLDEDMFFLESFGFGLFPNLMKEMKKVDARHDATPEENLSEALKVLLGLAKEYEARSCKLEIDGVDHSGNFLLVEVMNIRSLGPNLELNPLADTGDGEFEVILIPEDQREKFVSCLEDRIAGNDEPLCFSALKAKEISIKWDGIHGHVDDEVIKEEKPIKVKVVVQKHVLEFLLPDDGEATPGK